MLKNYLLVAWRNMRSRPMLSLINVIGLSISVAFCALLYFHLSYERSFDRFHVNGDRLYRLEMSDFSNDDPESKEHGLEFPLVVGPDMKSRFPEVNHIIVFKDQTYHMGDQLIRANKEVYKEKGVYYADSNFLLRFSFPLVKGDPRTVLALPGNVVLSAATAKKYFGREDAVGRTIELVSDSNRLFRVAGIIKDAPDNSSIQYTMILPATAAPDYARDLGERFNHMDYLTVVELKPGVDKAAFEQKLNGWMRTYFLPEVAEGFGFKPAARNTFRWWLRPLAEGHLNPSTPWGHFTDLQSIYQLGCIVIIILLLASLNYILITVSNAAARSKEVGVRKVMGAGRGSVVFQFWVETQLTVLIAVGVGMGLAFAGVPFLRTVIGSEVRYADISFGEVLAAALVLAVGLGLLAGYYPALLVSRLKPVSVMKGFRTFRIRPRFSRILVVVQFSCCVVLMLSALVIDRQMDYINHKGLGFDKDQVLMVHNPVFEPEFTQRVKERLYAFARTQPSILAYSAMNGGLNGSYNSNGFKLDGKQMWMKELTVDYNYFEMLGLKVVRGRVFSRDYPTDSMRKTGAMVVNESMWKLLGSRAKLGVYDETIYGTIIGVVKDYHFENLSQPVEPMVHQLTRHYASEFLFKVRAGEMQSTIAAIQPVWKEVTNNYPFEYTFLDQSIAQMYAADMRWRKAVEISSAFAIVIACLGLFGLSAITTVNRMKEIGIRKVLGATAPDLAATLSRGFLGMILLAFVIAAPVAGWLMNKWLQGYAARIEIGWWMYALVGAVALVVALATISMQVIRAALANPVDSLRTE
ncbi:MAG TPA: ABC transporter permease [Puia sp.]|jgi:putative ABC transport system permease protein|nr:ABC transporter permease [Puia sp.]